MTRLALTAVLLLALADCERIQRIVDVDLRPFPVPFNPEDHP